MNKKDLPKVFLNDGNIAQLDMPVREGYIDLGVRPNGYTQIRKPLGMQQIIAETAGNFIVYASAMRYLAEVIKCKDGLIFLESGKTWKEMVEGKPEKMILFLGGLQIYERGIPGITIDGFDLRKVGEIWYAEKPKSDYSNNLKQVIFGNSKKDTEREKRIEAILRGYESQKIAEERAERKVRHESYQQGRFDVISQ